LEKFNIKYTILKIKDITIEAKGIGSGIFVVLQMSNKTIYHD